MFRAGQKLFYMDDSIQAYAPAATAIKRWLSGGISPSIVIAAYEFKGAASRPVALTDLSGGGYTLSDVDGAVSWSSANGMEFIAAGPYLLSGIYPAGGGSMFVEFADGNIATNRSLAGVIDGANSFLLYNNVLGNRRYGNGGINQTSGAVTSGSMCVAGNKGYYNGSVDPITIPGWVGGASTRPLRVGVTDNNGFNLFYSYCNTYRVYVYSAALTGTQVAALHAS